MKNRIPADRSFVATGALAGLIGGVTIDLYLLAAAVGIEHRSVAQFYQFVASGVIGKSAYAEPGAAWLGLALHFVVSVMWGIGYAYAEQSTPQLRARPLLSGAVYGAVVLIAMLLVEIGANIYTIPRGNFELFNLLVSHVVFFGIPVAWVVTSRRRRAVAA